MKKLATLAVCALALCASLAHGETTFIGYTDGCFATTACPPPTTAGQPSQSFLGLTYSASTFNATTAGGFLALGADGPVNNLGTFTLNDDAHVYNGEHFDLRVTFTAPPGTAPGSSVYDTVLVGTVTDINHGGIFVDFDNTPRTFTFNGGSFTFAVNDTAVTGGHPEGITGEMRVSAVPEPETYMLFLGGIGVMGTLLRRRGVGRP